MNTIKYISALCLAAAVTSCGNKTVETNEDTRPVVKTQTVNERDVDQIGVYTATVEPELINNISAQMSNRIKEIYVDEGVHVTKGQKLVVLDDINTTTYQLQVDNAEANLRNIETDYNRAVELFNIGGGTKQQVDQMETQLINARNQLAAAQRNLQNVHENTVLTSPITGVVTARNYDPGDMTSAQPILTVARVQPVKIVINVTESELSRIKKGMPAEVTFDTYGNEKFQGTVTLISPTIDPSTRTMGVEVTLPNPDYRILPGMFGRVTLTLGTARHVVVPDRAVVKQTGSGNHYVYEVKDGKVVFHKVELGQRMGDSYELLSGIENNSEVIIAGQNKLVDGAEVKVTK